MSGTFETTLEILKPKLKDRNKIFYSIIGSLSIGILKEVIDSQEENNIFSFGDLTYDLGGSILGASISFYTHNLINNNFSLSYNTSKKILYLSYKF